MGRKGGKKDRWIGFSGLSTFLQISDFISSLKTSSHFLESASCETELRLSSGLLLEFIYQLPRYILFPKLTYLLNAIYPVFPPPLPGYPSCFKPVSITVRKNLYCVQRTQGRIELEYHIRSADIENQYSARDVDGDLYLIIDDINPTVVVHIATWKSREMTAMGQLPAVFSIVALNSAALLPAHVSHVIP